MNLDLRLNITLKNKKQLLWSKLHGAKKYTESIFTAPRSTRNAFSRRQTSRTQIHGIDKHGAESVNQKNGIPDDGKCFADNSGINSPARMRYMMQIKVECQIDDFQNSGQILTRSEK